MSPAMLPPAPGLFSITTVWPHTSCRRLPTRRAVISVEPPGVNGTTMRTGFAGQSAATALDTTSDGAATAAAARPTKRRRFSMALPPGVPARLARVVMFFAECGDRLQQNQCDEWYIQSVPAPRIGRQHLAPLAGRGRITSQM